MVLYHPVSSSKAPSKTIAHIYHAYLPSASLALLIFMMRLWPWTYLQQPLSLSKFPAPFSINYWSCDLSQDQLTFCPLRPSHAPSWSDRATLAWPVDPWSKLRWFCSGMQISEDILNPRSFIRQDLSPTSWKLRSLFADAKRASHAVSWILHIKLWHVYKY